MLFSEMSTGSDWSWPTVHGGEKSEDKEDTSNDDTSKAEDNSNDETKKTDVGGGLGLMVAEDRSRRISKLPPAEV